MNDNKIIIGLVGDLAAGKGTFCSYVQEKHGAHTYRFSNILRDLLTRLYLPLNRTNLQDISTLLRERFSQDILSKVIAEDVNHDSGSLIAIDGIRRPSDITYLKEHPGFHLVYITADQKLRWERMVTRNENTGDAAKTLEEFAKDEQAEADKLIKDLGSQAEFKITNNAGFPEFYNEIERILTAVGYDSQN
jgi:dephospho-CoA kinase